MRKRIMGEVVEVRVVGEGGVTGKGGGGVGMECGDGNGDSKKVDVTFRHRLIFLVS